MAKNTFFTSTAIDYPSGKPHAGHLYEKICTDVIARWERLKGKKVHFSTGLDCHGSKIERYAKEAGKSPKKFVEDMEKFFLKLCKDYNISYDDFIRTTEERHKKTVVKIVKDLHKKGDIYEGKYSGYYCSDCETYFSREDLVNGLDCPTHNKKTEFLEEDTYFFKMSKYQKRLIDYIKKNPNYIRPKKRRNEILSRLKEPLKDLSLTREKISWGIPFPGDDRFILAIWVDALINYLSTVNYPNKKYKEYWPALHNIGLDITWHHTVIWGSILLASGIKLPEVYVHGFIRSASGEKMSKSFGNVIDPLELNDKYPVDAIRYYLIREIPFGDDGDFSENRLVERLNNELANDLGNLLSRTLSMVERYFKGKIPKGKTSKDLQKKLDVKKVNSYMDKLELHHALDEIWKFVNECNKFVNKSKPWESDKKEEILYSLLDSLRVISILVYPFMPNTSEKINKQLGIKLGDLKDCKFGLLKSGKVGKKEILFKKIEDVGGSKKMEVSFEEFGKLDLRVGKILEAKNHPNADKLVVMKVDTGAEKRTVVAGIKSDYKAKDLVGKEITVVCNLKPAVLRGVKSEGMLLAAVDGDKVTLVCPEKKVKAGVKVS